MPYNQSKAKIKSLPHIILIMAMGIIITAESYFGYKLYKISFEQEQLKADYATANNISFGIFSIDLWRDKIAAIVKGKIKEFEITKDQKKDIKEEVEEQLHEMVDDIVSDINKPQKSLGGKLKKFAFRQFVEPKELHQQVPIFAQIIVSKISSPKAVNKVKDIAITEFDELAQQTYDSTATAQWKMRQYFFKKYEVNNALAFNKVLEKRFVDIRKVTYNYAYLMLGCAFLGLLLWFPIRKQPSLQSTLFLMSLVSAIALLIISITVSIIEVDARMSSLNLTLMGEKITFQNQVLFYQSKSIWGIATVLCQQSKLDAVTVGILIIIFVIILPIVRMLARGLHLVCKPIIRENAITKYLAFETGKWDMTDVMVVGILMTYIGLNGILQSQLGGLNLDNDTLKTTTVNNSSLQPGFIIFVGYVIFSLILSYFLKSITCNRLPEQASYSNKTS